MDRQSKKIGVVQAIWPPMLLVLIGLPLAFKLIAPNPFYGVRMSETIGSPDLWYQANLYAGWVAVIFGSAAALTNVSIVRSPRIPTRKKWWLTLGTFLLAAGAMVVAGQLAG